MWVPRLAGPPVSLTKSGDLSQKILATFVGVHGFRDPSLDHLLDHLYSLHLKISVYKSTSLILRILYKSTSLILRRREYYYAAN